MTIFNQDELLKILRAVERGEGVVVTSEGDQHGIVYDEDELGKYAVIGFTLPLPLWAEIEDGTYGELQGFRVYLNEAQAFVHGHEPKAPRP